MSEYEIPKVKKTIYTVVIKRLIDIVLSLCAIIILSPLLLIIAILELIFHGWPIIYKQPRPGLNEKVFNIYKFRSMTDETDENGEPLPGYMRVTKFGSFIRKFSLDELPELFCILFGTMSIVGPRPLRVEYLGMYNERHAMRHAVRPGLACANIRQSKSTTRKTWREQFENDIWYVENCSFIIDVKMIFAIVKEALHPNKNRIGATREPFDGTNLDS